MEHLQYPIGRFEAPARYDEAMIAQAIADLADLPAQLRAALEAAGPDQLDTPYRPEGWTLRQLTHHVADSHTQALARIKKALAEDTPEIMAYPQDAFVHMADSELDVAPSLAILEGIHARLAALAQSLSADDRLRDVFHPERRRAISINEMLVHYAWHGRHHVAHVRLLVA